MKIQLNTRLFPQYNSILSIAQQRAKKEEAAKKEAEQKAKEELYNNLGKIKSFAIGTTPNFTIDLNKDMLSLDEIDQLIVTFGQFGKVVQREILYFSDNYRLDYEVDSEGNYIDHSAEVVIDDRHIFDDEPYVDSEGHLRHRYQTIRNPKFTYNRQYNQLTLTLSQMDTLTHFKPTNWKYNKDDPNTDLEDPYYEDNPSLVMVEVKIRVRRAMDRHNPAQVIIRPQEYYAVAQTIENSLEKMSKPVLVDNNATPIYVPHRFRLYYDDYCVPETERPLPMRVDELDNSKQIATAILCRDGLRVRSYPQFGYYTSEGEYVKQDPIRNSEGFIINELSRYFCVMIPLHIKVKIKDIKILFGGSPGIMDHVDFDSEGRVIPTYIKYPEHLYDSEGNPLYDEDGNPIFATEKNETIYYQSNYVIDPDGGTPDNPMGEYICWYICSKDTITGNISRFYGPSKYREDQKREPCYEFLIRFEELGKASH